MRLLLLYDSEIIESHFGAIILLLIKNFKEIIMLNRVKLTEREMKEFAEVFAYYDYGSEEIGMVPLFPDYPDRKRLVDYLVAMIRTANEYDAVYATSDKKEGIIIITDTSKPYPASVMIKMMWRMMRALGFSNFLNIMKKFQAGGASQEKEYRDSKKQFVQIELLAVRKEYQGKGFMRPLVETAFEIGQKEMLPVIVSTDAKLKKDKYEHIGMKHMNTRKLDEKSFMYDLVREPVK
jgi:ribosomal protein S18 acetylase RimI-like enzyme